MTKFQKTFLYGVAVSVLAFTSASAESRDFDFDGFSRVGASAGVNVEVTAGADYSVRVESNDAGFGELKITNKNGALNIGRNRANRSFGKRQSKISVYVTLPALNGVNASSGSDVDAKGIDADKFSVHVSSGADVSLAGECSHLDAGVSSGSDLNGESLQCRTADVSASSGADATVYASEKVDANASSGSDITVYGRPENNSINKSSGGGVSIRN